MLTKKSHYNLCIVWRLVTCWGCRLHLKKDEDALWSCVTHDSPQCQLSAWKSNCKWWQPCWKDYCFVLETGRVNLSYRGCIMHTHSLPPLPCAPGFPLLPSSIQHWQWFQNAWDQVLWSLRGSRIEPKRDTRTPSGLPKPGHPRGLHPTRPPSFSWITVRF